LVRQLDFILHLISMERGDVSRSISIFWCLAAVRSNILADNSRFGEFNSRLGPREFPVGIAAGILSQALDLDPLFTDERRVCRENR
jgi:hypothetical protein